MLKVLKVSHPQNFHNDLSMAMSYSGMKLTSMSIYQRAEYSSYTSRELGLAGAEAKVRVMIKNVRSWLIF